MEVTSYPESLTIFFISGDGIAIPQYFSERIPFLVSIFKPLTFACLLKEFLRPMAQLGQTRPLILISTSESNTSAFRITEKLKISIDSNCFFNYALFWLDSFLN